MASQNPSLASAEELKQKDGEGKITEEICPKYNVDENSSATHKVFLRAVECCSTTQMIAIYI